jgi:protein ImuB
VVRTVVVWCPDWPVVAAGMAGGPAAVLQAGRVLACSPAARAEGVHPGLRRREAQARCPALELLPADPDRDARAFEPVLAAVEALTPRVEAVRPGECAFPARGAARYLGGEEVLTATVTAAVDAALGGRAGDDPTAAVDAALGGRAGGRCRVGIADGAFAAGLAARRGAVVPPGGSRAFLASFPVGVLERPDLADLLVRLGLGTLGDLAALPRTAVATRFGPEGVRAHRLASGLDDRPPDLRRPPPDLRVTAELDPPADRVDVAAFAAKALADELLARLERHGLACTRLHVEAETEHGETLGRTWRLDVAPPAPGPGARLAAAMVERARWQLEGWLSGRAADRPTGGVTRLTLAPDQVAPDRGRQLGFWGGESGQGERAARALLRLQGLLGAGAVRTAGLRGGRDPADRVAFADPLEAPAQAGGGPGPAPWPGRVPAPAPAIVHPRPLPAEVVDATGTPVGVGGRGLASAAPSRLRVGDGPWQEVAAWAGPWPVDERWWDRGASRRLARLQVATAAGTAYLLRLTDGRWWVEATYD